MDPPQQNELVPRYEIIDQSSIDLKVTRANWLYTWRADDFTQVTLTRYI